MRVMKCIYFEVVAHLLELALNDFNNYQVHLRWCMAILAVVRQRRIQMTVI